MRNRALLIAAARRVLAEEPRASMESIALAAGLGRNTIHRHFATRQDLLDAVGAEARADVVNDGEDRLRPPGELGSPVPPRVLESSVLNKVPPFRLGEQLVAEAQRLAGVSSAAIYLVDLDGRQLRRLAGPELFPASLDIAAAVGPEIPLEGFGPVREMIRGRLPNVIVAPMFLRGRATGVIVALGSGADDDLREIANVAAVTLALGERYSDQPARVARARPTSAAAEIQQNMLPPRIVRVSGAMIAGNVTPSYEIGGDWFDYAENPEGTWLGIADTEGNGPRTAALATVLLGAFRAERRTGSGNIATVVRAMHQTVEDLAEFAAPISSTVALWQGATSIVQWITCGSERPVVVSGEQVVMVGESNPPLGDPDFPRRLRVQSRRLSPRERMLFVSDGLLERPDRGGAHYGLRGLEATLAEIGASSSAARIVHSVTRAAQRHGVDAFEDDATIVVLEPSDRA